MLRMMACCALGLGLLVTPGVGEEPKTKADSKMLKLESEKDKKYCPACRIDFRGELGLSYRGIGTIGSRIESARLNSDPVALALAANELAIAEKVSGKQATLTAKEVAKEAVTLAEARMVSQELKAVSLALADADAQKKMTELAKDAEKIEQEAKDATREGAKPKGIHGELVVYNYCSDDLHIYYNGWQVGVVSPGTHRHFHVHDHSGQHFTLTSRYCDGCLHSTHHRHGNFSRFTWTLR